MFALQPTPTLAYTVHVGRIDVVIPSVSSPGNFGYWSGDDRSTLTIERVLGKRLSCLLSDDCCEYR